MTDFAALLTALRRPRILIRAARAGLSDHRRDRDQKRSPGSERAFGALLAEEDALEAHRTSGEATYDLRRHVAVLTALLAEARRAQSLSPF